VDSDATVAGQQALAAFVREARRRLGLSMRDLAQLSGLSKSTVDAIEQVTNGPPRRHTLDRLAAALGVAPDYLAAILAGTAAPAAQTPAERAAELLASMSPGRQRLTLHLLLVLADRDLQD
jgi:transcriptional regulator with XRE-family HTH domain